MLLYTGRDIDPVYLIFFFLFVFQLWELICGQVVMGDFIEYEGLKCASDMETQTEWQKQENDISIKCTIKLLKKQKVFAWEWHWINQINYYSVTIFS